MAKQLKYTDDARKAMKDGVDKLASSVYFNCLAILYISLFFYLKPFNL